MSERFGDRNPAQEILAVMQELKTSGVSDITAAQVQESLVGKYFDFDAADFQGGMAELLAQKLLVLSFERKLSLVAESHTGAPTGSKELR